MLGHTSWVSFWFYGSGDWCTVGHLELFKEANDVLGLREGEGVFGAVSGTVSGDVDF